MPSIWTSVKVLTFSHVFLVSKLRKRGLDENNGRSDR